MLMLHKTYFYLEITSHNLNHVIVLELKLASYIVNSTPANDGATRLTLPKTFYMKLKKRVPVPRLTMVNNVG
jgi:hypothetical protein